MTNLIRIVAVVVDTKKATLYKQDGTTIEMLQGDVRLRPLLEHVSPLLATQNYADVDLSTENTWKEFEEKTGGAVTLFRIAKSKLASLFKSKGDAVAVEPTSLGTVPSTVKVDRQEQANKNMEVVNEILKHATPVAAPGFDEEKVAPQRPVVEGNSKTPTDRTEDGSDGYHDKHEDTIVAITPKGGVVVGVEKIKSQFAAAKQGNTQGLTIFLERLAAVRSKRSHTPDELLRFMERGDLPIANDGTIIIYKRLQRHGEGYVDVHTKRVVQKVGSFVHMDPSLVDHNRRNECSNGLHVARRGYINNFSGDVVVLAKVRPEDVIAVPNYDANKMRVCGYHIIAELTQKQFTAIVSNRPISDAPGGAELLGCAIAGQHIGITETVKIGGQEGHGLTVTQIVDHDVPQIPSTSNSPATAEHCTEPAKKTPAASGPPVKKVSKTISKKAKKAKRKVAVKKATTVVKKASTLEAAGVRGGDVPVDVRAVNKLKAGDDQALKMEPTQPITQSDVVKAMWDAALSGIPGKAQALLDFKKKAKKGWHTWGLPDNAGETLKALLG